jgi:L-threonylcarbamoyladenylate synthase
MRQVSKELQVPIVSTSANISGKKDAPTVSELDAAVSSSVDLIIDGGKCKYAQGSTIIDLINMKIVRKGAVRDGDKFEFG